MAPNHIAEDIYISVGDPF